MEQDEHSLNFFLFFFAFMILYFILVYNLQADVWLRRKISGRFRRFLLPAISSEHLPHLVRCFPFYNKLNDNARRLFEGRVQNFINEKEFIPRGGYETVTGEMKALIAGSAVQLTFGYPTINFRHFGKILIYPDDYYSTITKKYHKGEVNQGGIIVLSWKNLTEGFRNQEDGVHLGLHEMAHALRLINIVDNEEYDFYDRALMQDFDREALLEIQKMEQDNGEHFFRSYGATNPDEFFAVAVEVFFELPDGFFAYHPRLYAMMAAILKMDLRIGSPRPFSEKAFGWR
ncbi:MAG: zinc-dependent peptidase [Bacteroidales bacterium]